MNWYMSALLKRWAGLIARALRGGRLQQQNGACRTSYTCSTEVPSIAICFEDAMCTYTVDPLAQYIPLYAHYREICGQESRGAHSQNKNVLVRSSYASHRLARQRKHAYCKCKKCTCTPHMRAAFRRGTNCVEPIAVCLSVIRMSRQTQLA